LISEEVRRLQFNPSDVASSRKGMSRREEELRVDKDGLNQPPWRKVGRTMNNESTQSNPANFKAEEGLAFASLCESIVFGEFELEMDESLERLVGKWVHLAAPNADRIRRLVKPSKPSKPAS
jgi:hypothetical protein